MRRTPFEPAAAPLAAGAAGAPSVALPHRMRMTRAFQALLDRFERVFAAVSLLLLSGGIVTLLRDPGGDPTLAENDPVRRGLFFLIYGVTLLLVLRRPRGVVRAASRHLPTLMLVALAALSVLWSAAPDVTLRRGVALLGTTLFGLYLASAFEPRELLRLLAWTLALVAALSLGTAVLAPAYGVHWDAHDGAWRGIFMHKNGFGKVMALAALVFLLQGCDRAGWRKRAWWAAAGLATALTLLSRSSSSLVILAALLSLLPLYRTLRWRNPLLLPLLIAFAFLGGIVVAAAVALSGDLLALLGRDATLTGRTELWAAALEMVGPNLLVGYGYGAFWQVSLEAETLYAALGWRPWTGHNGFLDLLLQVGVVGLLIFAVGLLIALRRALATLRFDGGPEATWPIVFLSFLFLSNLTESMILEHNGLYWALFVATVTSAIMAPRAPAARARSARGGAPADPQASLSPGIRRRLRRGGSPRAEAAG
jgi:exopolysaccharide production protein ExoQ